ncbi:MAG: hypothetical protein AAF663_01735 [Planctomycetota bacterium]
MFSAVLDAFIEAYKSILDWVMSWVESWLPFDLSDMDPTSVLDFAGGYIADLNNYFPLVPSMSIVLTGAGVKYAIRAARIIIGWIPTVEG